MFRFRVLRHHNFRTLRIFSELTMSFVFEFLVLLTKDLFLSTTYRVYSDADCALRRFVTVSGVVVSLRCFKRIERDHPKRTFKENTLNVVYCVNRTFCAL